MMLPILGFSLLGLLLIGFFALMIKIGGIKGALTVFGFVVVVVGFSVLYAWLINNGSF